MRTMWMRAVLVVLILLGSSAAPAQELSVDECLEVHERGQVERTEDRLKEAAASFAICAHASCPEALRLDCSQWSEEAKESIPSVVFVVRRGDKQSKEAAIFVDGERLVDAVGQESYELDPGRHDIEVHLDEEVLRRTVVLSQGEKGRTLAFEFASEVEASAPAVSSSAAPPGPRETEPRAREKVPTLTYFLSGTAVIATGVGVGFLSSGLSLRSELRETCAPYCSEAERSKVDSQLLGADVSFGIALASGIGALVVYLTQPRASRARSSVQARGPVVFPVGTTQGAALFFREGF